MEHQKQRKKVEKIEKQIVGIFIFIGVVTLILGYFQLKSSIASPFQALKTDLNRSTTEEKQTQELLALRSKDSDGDSLTDYDELYQYKTSPYITDSDSDGYMDSEELESGHDPNCPEGRECNHLATETTGNTEDTTDIDNIANIGPEELRGILLENGVSQASLDELDDETLMNYYQEFIANETGDVGDKYSDNTNVTTQVDANDPNAILLSENVNSTVGVENAQDLANLTPTEIRNFLIKTGDFDEQTLAEIDDNQLEIIFKESLRNQNIIE